MDMDSAVKHFESQWNQYWSSKPKHRSGQAFRRLLENIEQKSCKEMNALVERIQPASDKELVRLKLKNKYRELEESLVSGNDWALIGDYDPYKNFSKERIDSESEQIIASLHRLWSQLLEPIKKMDEYVSCTHHEVDAKKFHKKANKSLDRFMKDINQMESKDHMHHRFRQMNILWEIRQLRKSLYRDRPEYAPANWLGVDGSFEKLVREFISIRENWTLIECINIAFGYAHFRDKKLFTEGQDELLRKAKSSMLSGLKPTFKDSSVDAYQFKPSTFMKWLGTTDWNLGYAQKAEKWIHEERKFKNSALDSKQKSRLSRDEAHIKCAIFATYHIEELKQAKESKNLTANKLATVMHDQKRYLEHNVEVELKSEGRMREVFANNIFKPIVAPAQMALAQLRDGCHDPKTKMLDIERIKGSMGALGLTPQTTPENELGMQNIDEILSAFLL